MPLAEAIFLHINLIGFKIGFLKSGDYYLINLYRISLFLEGTSEVCLWSVIIMVFSVERIRSDLERMLDTDVTVKELYQLHHDVRPGLYRQRDFQLAYVDAGRFQRYYVIKGGNYSKRSPGSAQRMLERYIR